jgi:hypothetical protein
MVYYLTPALTVGLPEGNSRLWLEKITFSLYTFWASQTIFILLPVGLVAG